MHSFPRE